MKYPVFLLLLLFVFSCQQQPPHNESVMASEAMVVSAHPLASQAGLDIIKNGGNAVDAAIAVQFALTVVHPSAGNIGGGGFMVYRQANGETFTLDFREKAPANASRNMYLDADGAVIDQLSTRGHLASGVPGSVDGMVKAYERFGTLPWEDLVAPSVALARQGHALTEKEAAGLNYLQEDLTTYNSETPSSFMNDWKEGDIIVHEDLAGTMERIQRQGRAGFYEGETADLIVAEMERGKGLISHEDLKNYESKWREPVIGFFDGYKIISMGPPSSGGIALIQLLQSVESRLGSATFHSPDAIHLMVEAERRVYADRATHLGDPDFYPVPIQELINIDYNNARMESFDPEQATRSAAIAAGEVPYESPQTTHFSIVDAEGNAVSITTTLNGGYGSKVVVGGAGFLLNNEMDDFSIKPGYPNMFGLVGGEANAIQPQKRMLSSMTPTIVEKDGKLKMVVGTPGGSTIITSVFQTILNVLAFDMGMQEAVNARRFHHQWKPDEVIYERSGLDSKTVNALEQMGHTMTEVGNIGRVDAILVLPDGTLEGGADPRGDDAAVGY